MKVHNRGRPSQKRRWVSKFEAQQVKEAKKACPSKCSYCKQAGHCQDTCPVRLTDLEIDISDFDIQDEDESPNTDCNGHASSSNVNIKVADETPNTQTDNKTRSKASQSISFAQVTQPITRTYKTDNNTTSIASQVSHSQVTQPIKRIYKCSICKQPRHRANRCPNKGLSHVSLVNVKELSTSLEKRSLEVIKPDNLTALKSSPLDAIGTSSFTEIKSSILDIPEIGTSNLTNHKSSIFDIPPKDSDYDTDKSDTSYTSESDNQDLCPFCDDPLPSNPSDRLMRLKSVLFALPNIRKREGHPDAMSLPFPQTASFCYLHNAEREVIPMGIRKGWPTSIDFVFLEQRIQDHHNRLSQIIKREIPSSYLDIATSKWKTQG